MEIDEELIRSVKGFLDEDEGRCLYEVALKASRLGPCLEIGSYCGKSTLYLGSACKSTDAILFSIDHHRGSEEQQPGEEYFDPALIDPRTGRVDTFREFRETLERGGMEDTVVPLVCSSQIAARQWATPLGLVFIDGGHSFESVINDFNAWAGHIISGGYLLIHDIFANQDEGGQAPYQIYNMAVASGKFQKVSMVKTLGVLRRLDCAEIPKVGK